MSKIYKFYTDFNFSSFTENFPLSDTKDLFFYDHNDWQNYNGKNYVFSLLTSNFKKKKYDFDISTNHLGIVIFSEKAIDCLSMDLLNKFFTPVNIITESKRKKYFGFYPNKNIYDDNIIDFNLSSYRRYIHEETKKISFVFDRVKLNHNAPINDEFFVLKSYFCRLFFNDKIKNIIDKNNLIGCEFDPNLLAYDSEWLLDNNGIHEPKEDNTISYSKIIHTYKNKS